MGEETHPEYCKQGGTTQKDKNAVQNPVTVATKTDTTHKHLKSFCEAEKDPKPGCPEGPAALVPS
jgi:hypothetical protein